MTLRILLLAAVTVWTATAQDTACRAVRNDRIQARDLAAVLPEFAAAPPEALLAQAPLPGSQKIFHATELAALARRLGVPATAAADVCFEWEMRPLDRDAVVSQMRESLAVPEATIEIAEISNARVPPGRLDFPLSKLAPPSAGQRTPVLWRGDVVYGDDHRVAVWARVSLSVPCRKVTAAESLKAGELLEPRHLRVSSATCFPVSAKDAPSADAFAGMVVTRAISAGAEIRTEFLAPPNDVNRGDTVQVEVRSGAARLALTARALSGGRTGDTITVRNPESNKIFPARITGKGAAVVQAGGPKGS